MEKHNRRVFLRQTSMAVGAASAVAAVPGLPAALGSAVTRTAESPVPRKLTGASLAEPLVAHVRDVATGEIDLFVGTEQITYRDPELATRLFKATR